MPRYRGVFPAFIHFAGARLLSRTGAQLYARDKFSKGKPLLEVMAEPGSSFFEALKNFERVEVYANALQDRTVPFPTGGIAAHDFFDEARRKSREARDSLKLLRDNEEGEKLDMREGGMEMCVTSPSSIEVELTVRQHPRRSLSFGHPVDQGDRASDAALGSCTLER